jgi:hypothetical protein
MLDWLKDKIKQGADAGGRFLIAKAMQEHFACGWRIVISPA